MEDSSPGNNLRPHSYVFNNSSRSNSSSMTTRSHTEGLSNSNRSETQSQSVYGSRWSLRRSLASRSSGGASFTSFVSSLGSQRILPMILRSSIINQPSNCSDSTDNEDQRDMESGRSRQSNPRPSASSVEFVSEASSSDRESIASICYRTTKVKRLMRRQNFQTRKFGSGREENPPAVRIVRPSDSITQFSHGAQSSDRITGEGASVLSSLPSSSYLSAGLVTEPAPNFPSAQPEAIIDPREIWLSLMHSFAAVIIKCVGMCLLTAVFFLAFLTNRQVASTVDLMYALFHCCLSLFFMTEIFTSHEDTNS